MSLSGNVKSLLKVQSQACEKCAIHEKLNYSTTRKQNEAEKRKETTQDKFNLVRLRPKVLKKIGMLTINCKVKEKVKNYRELFNNTALTKMK